MPSGAQWCLRTLIPAGGFSAYQMVFEPNSADLFGWDDTDEDLIFTQDTSLAGQFVQNWKLRMRAQEAALNAVAKSKLRRLLAYSKSFTCPDIALRDSVLFDKATDRRSSPRWRGAAGILDIDGTGAAATFQNQTFKAARYCVRMRTEEKDAHEAGRQATGREGDPRMGHASVCPDLGKAP